ncbi:unnamed protein product [Rotaria sp. Silwood1]|nr:unnamed protein product [Rotaria sp. Silwood1]CAF1458949.1 unnamed protein product [Rotaria sp. Silwood1]CAF3551575.1 unnamed protein product [Rotaria sp. Silwood1]CAF3626562.1 unnamed protein product [Rotaria sp. Silwood1]CAF4657378.1 unnamed protein product [Rotaria sp. Silwood1]
MLRVLDSMSFYKLIEECGPPFRSYDIFDEVYASIYDALKRENDHTTNHNSTSILEHIKELANQPLLNASCMRDNLPKLPHVYKELVNAAIKE